MNDEKILANVLESNQQYEDSITGSFTRVEEIEEASWYDRLKGDEDYEWDDIFTKYEKFMQEVGDTLQSYQLDVETREPYLRLNVEGSAQGFHSRNNVVSYESTADGLELEDHKWKWKPTENISLDFRYQTENAYNEEQVGVQIDVDDVNGAIVTEIVELAEDWFGEEKDWIKKSSDGTGLLY